MKRQREIAEGEQLRQMHRLARNWEVTQLAWYWKRKKAAYQDLAIGAFNLAMAINLKDEAAFENYPVNNLEAVIAIFWMVERSLNGLPEAKREMAGSHIMDELLSWLRCDYSSEEMSELVIPMFDRRLNEYSDLFAIHSGERERRPFLRTFKRIVENVFGEDEAHIARIMGAILVWWQPIAAEGARIADLDRRGDVAW